ncbi:pumilio domain-containing protein [Boeremia exigua]|uniref:pumilio domain-containing protein n=1 Tax=Boeremia exigua TaxID=749465 RepID=UPI001E8E6371|nr:pumilio domain-containing protein [Boeremia exigua]KAH6614841.1 pumilio domain-containing protein [Boeremia exigua]
MAGIKSKPAVDAAPAKVRKDKSEKKSSKSDSKHAVKPVKKSKKVAEDVEMADSDSEGKAKSKTQKRKAEDESTEQKKKSKYETPGEISSKLADIHANNSREAHQKQKALAKERKNAKPNADVIERSKKLWEKLRLKSHIEKDERKELVKELFEIITGRVKDFVFKHDSVRVIQTAIKYSTMEQRRMIARELKGEFKILSEGKYSKFLIAKLVEKGDPEIRDLIITEFYGHVKRMINHPEAAWILDDIYRAVATPEQKNRMLREWYGAEFSIAGLGPQGTESADLATILEESPEKRKPIMSYLENQINSLIQKKLNGFTMLHDAMLQYFLVCEPGTEQANDFLEHLKPDPTLKEGEEADNVDLMKNLAFTKSGSRLVSLCFAYGTAKDRKLFLRPYKDTVEVMAFDQHAHHVLLAALAVTDDTKLSSKSIYSELLPSNDALPEKVLNLCNDARARTVLLYPFAADAKWFLDDNTRERLAEIYAIREKTSKKDPNTRLQEVTKSIEAPLLNAITARAADFASFTFGLQFMGEILVGAPEIEPATRKDALTEVARLSQSILDASLPASAGDTKATSHGKNMLKTLVQGGKFDPKTKKVVPVTPALGFADMLWAEIKSNVIDWATGEGSFVVVALTEADGFAKKSEVLKALKKDKKKLEAAAGPAKSKDADAAAKKGKKGDKKDDAPRGNAGARILLEKL